MSKGLKRVFIILLIFYLIIAGVVFYGIWKRNKLYNSHSWNQVEAVYQSSSGYTEKETHKDSRGYEYKEKVTKYTYHYTYQVDGQTYDCYEKDNLKEEPYESDLKRTIMVAADDPGLHLMYANEEQYKQSVGNSVFAILGTGVILLFIIGGKILRQYLIRGTSRLVNKTVNDAAEKIREIR